MLCDHYSILPEQYFNFRGRRLKYITVHFFPSVDFTDVESDVAVPVKLHDCVEGRLINALAIKGNFT